MTWGCTITDAVVQWGTAFSLRVEHLQLSVDDSYDKFPMMGRSGAGKSTLLNLIAALKWPVQGRVSWSFPDGKRIDWGKNGSPLSAQEVLHLRRRYFGFLFQDSILISHLRVWENMSYPIELRGESTRIARDKAREALQRVLLPDEKVDTLLRSFPHELSGGQRQRVALVQALIHDPAVLFADEPTGNLDGKTRKEVMEFLNRWLRDTPGQRLLIWVTHHDDDPVQAAVTRRVKVTGGTCRWQIYRAGYWQDAEL